MSSAVVSTSAALGRPFLFDAPDPHVGTAAPGCPVEQSSTAMSVVQSASDVAPGSKKPASSQTPSHEAILASVFQSKIGNRQSAIPLSPASRLTARPALEMASSGLATLDSLTGGLPRGCLTEISGSASAGRTSVLLAALAAATRRGEYCALIDAGDALDPHSAAAAGLDLDRLLWVRCNENSPQRHRDTDGKKSQESGVPHFSPLSREMGNSERRLEQVLRATDLLLESGGFGLIALDLADIPPQSARQVPLTTWFRFRRTVEHKPTILLSIAQQPIAGSCSSLVLKLEALNQCSAFSNEQPAHAQLLHGLEIEVEQIHSRLNRKPVHSITFETKTAWAR